MSTPKPIAILTPTEELKLICDEPVLRWGGLNPKRELLYIARTRREVIAQFECDHWPGYWRECYRRGCRIKRIALTQHNVDAATREVELRGDA